jgi:hypothetical protein
VQEAKESAVETVRERGGEETKELASSLRGEAQDDAPTQLSGSKDRAEQVVGQAG